MFMRWRRKGRRRRIRFLESCVRLQILLLSFSFFFLIRGIFVILVWMLKFIFLQTIHSSYLSYVRILLWLGFNPYNVLGVFWSFFYLKYEVIFFSLTIASSNRQLELCSDRQLQIIFWSFLVCGWNLVFFSTITRWELNQL